MAPTCAFSRLTMSANGFRPCRTPARFCSRAGITLIATPSRTKTFGPARPDGTNPIALWGKCDAQAALHISGESDSRQPQDRVHCVGASRGHGRADLRAGPRGGPEQQDAITRITPGPYPEAESNQIAEYCASPWPLSEKYFLVAYSRDRLIFEGEHQHNPNPDNALGLYLLDAAGNRELIYRDAKLSSTSPIPLRPQPMPPALPSALIAEAPPTGEMLITDIYQGLGDVPRGTIKELRIVQIFPKTTWLANSPRVGIAGEENTRAILGTVPVEADGSARFIVPAHKPVLFQALDKDGFAYQTMRSTTYVQPANALPVSAATSIACPRRRKHAPCRWRCSGPHLISNRGELGGRPFAFVEVVQPVLNKHCVKCHSGSRGEEGGCSHRRAPRRVHEVLCVPLRRAAVVQTTQAATHRPAGAAVRAAQPDPNDARRRRCTARSAVG